MKTQFNERNISMVMDMYELTMTNGYFNQGMGNTLVVFDVFYRNNPDNAGFTSAAVQQPLLQSPRSSSPALRRSRNGQSP